MKQVRRAKIRRVNDPIETIGSTNAPLPAAFHKDWDKAPGLQQTRAHVELREKQGRKMTPKGPGKMTSR